MPYSYHMVTTALKKNFSGYWHSIILIHGQLMLHIEQQTRYSRTIDVFIPELMGIASLSLRKMNMENPRLLLAA